MKNQRVLLTILGCFLVLATSAQQGGAISKTDWDVFSENYQPAPLKDTLFQGKMSMRLDAKSQAVAFRKNSSYKNFRIDLDIAGDVMSGIGFRASDQHNYQFLYFRPGYGGTREAIQYIPVYNGALSWVIYNYPVYETSADIKAREWFHVSMEVKEGALRVFVNNSKTPQMEIQLIGTDHHAGNILLRSMFGTSWFSNVYIRELPDVLSDWEISEQFPRKQTLDLDPSTKSATWKKIKPDQADFINISQYFKHPDGVVIAKHKISSSEEKDMLLYFDFCGKLKIFLNGKEVFYYEKQILDRIFAGTLRIPLKVKKGDNELIFVSEGDAVIFGKGYSAMGRLQHQNWGFVAELGKK